MDFRGFQNNQAAFFTLRDCTSIHNNWCAVL